MGTKMNIQTGVFYRGNRTREELEKFVFESSNGSIILVDYTEPRWVIYPEKRSPFPKTEYGSICSYKYRV